MFRYGYKVGTGLFLEFYLRHYGIRYVYGSSVEVGRSHSGAVHVHGHGRNHFLVHRIELLHVARHLLGFLAVARALCRTLLVHVADVLDAAVDAVDGVDLRRYAAELDVVDGVEATDVLVESLHLFHISLGAAGDSLGVFGYGLIACEERVAHLI